MKIKVKPIKKKVIKTREDLLKIIDKIDSHVYCIAKDKNGKIITPYLYTVDYFEEGNGCLFQDVVGEVRIYKNKDIGRYYDMTKIARVYAEIDAYPIYKDWIEFPITDVYLYAEETTDLLNHYKMLGMWRDIK